MPGHIPFTACAKKILELALGESLDLTHQLIGPELLLLGMVRGCEGTAMQVMSMLGASHQPLAKRSSIVWIFRPVGT